VTQSTISSEERDRRYQEMLKTSDGFLAVWGQQPGNIAALNRYLEELKTKILAVRRAAIASPETGKSKIGSAQTSPKSGHAEAPAGPVKNSAKRSPPDEAEVRAKATSRFRPAGPRPPAPSLAGVPNDRIRVLCDSAEIQLAKLGELIHSVPCDTVAIGESVKRLNELLHSYQTPIEVPEPVNPRPKQTPGK
jgi:hypothetical protein